MRSPRLRCAGACLLIASLVAPAASAQPPRQPTAEDKALAEALFLDARKLMEAGQFKDACPKLAQSQELDPSGGTLLNLAVCHEKEGKTASAWAEYKEAATLSEAAGKKDRAELARARAAELEKQLSRLVLEVEAPAKGMVILLNGKELSAAAATGTPMPVDPGDHTVEATAPGKKTWSAKVALEAGASSKKVVIPALEDAAAAPPVEPVKPQGPAGPVVPAGPQEAPGGGSTLRTLAIVAGGVGLAGLAVGSVFGIMTFGHAGDAGAECGPGDLACGGARQQAYEDGRTTGLISTLGFGVGLAGVGAGVALFVLSGKSAPADSAKAPRKQAGGVWVAPEVGARGGQLKVGGRW